jgi:hypothetical protein
MELSLNNLYICITKSKIMIHTVKIDDRIPSGKRIIKDLRRFRKVVKFENPIVDGNPPVGYLTSEEFWAKSKESVDKICEENGLL